MRKKPLKPVDLELSEKETSFASHRYPVKTSQELRGITATNSNTRVSPATLPQAVSPRPTISTEVAFDHHAKRLCQVMIERLRLQGITDERVLKAMASVPRHCFVDPGLASQAYDNVSLPIGYAQTLSQPWVVARMIMAVCENRSLARVLEVGTGCGYQAAVLAQLVPDVYGIERIRGLYELARTHLRMLRLNARVRLTHGDGMEGLPNAGPFDAIVVSAAGLVIPQALLSQLALGGRLIAPEGEANQCLVLVERTGVSTWKRVELEAVRFVPLKPGVLY